MKTSNLVSLLFIINLYSSFVGANEFADFIPKSPLYLLDTIDTHQKCANQNIISHYQGGAKKILIDEIQNASGNPLLPNGLRGMFLTTLFKMVSGSEIKIVDHAFGGNENWQYFVAGQVSGFDRGLGGDELGGGLFLKFFGIGFGDSRQTSLLQMDFRLIVPNGEIAEVVSLATVLKHLDDYKEFEGQRNETGLYIDWGQSSGNSLTLAQRIIVNEAALIFMEKVTGLALRCEKKKYSNTRIEVTPIEHEAFDDLVKSKHYYFPAKYQKAFNCKKGANINCHIGFKGKLNTDIVNYVEQAFTDAFNEQANIDVSCSNNSGKLTCSATGILTSFSAHKFKRNLYRS